MALFGEKESKEEKQARKAMELLQRYGLDALTDPKDLDAVKKIANDLSGNALIAAGAALQGKSTDAAMLTYYAALVEQNWIIIRMLNKLTNK